MNLTVKQEAFAQAYVETGNASEAYRRAYDVGENTKDETVWRKAAELMDNGKVTARIEELQAEHRKRHEVTVDSLTEELEAARLKAMSADNGASAAVQAIVAKGKLHGLIVDKSKAELSGPNGTALQTQRVTPDYSGWEEAVDGRRCYDG